MQWALSKAVLDEVNSLGVKFEKKDDIKLESIIDNFPRKTHLVIKYRLGFNDASDDYAYLASQILKNRNANVIKTDDEIIIYIDGNEEDIKSAFLLLGEELPLSLYLSAQSVEEATMMPPNRQPLRLRIWLCILM